MSSFEQYRRTLALRYETFQKELDSVMQAYAHGDEAAKKQAIERMLRSLENLGDIIHQQDWPAWIRPIRDAARTALTSYTSNAKKQLLQEILRRWHRITPIEVREDGPSLNFDEMFGKYRESGRLPQLFDEMIDAITKILESGAVDSQAVGNALRRLLEALKANRDGSYLGIFATLNYARLVKNYVIEFLKEVKAVKVFVTALDRTIQESEAEFKEVIDRFKDDSVAMIADSDTIHKIKQLPGKHPLLLEPPPSDEEVSEMLQIEALASTQNANASSTSEPSSGSQ